MLSENLCTLKIESMNSKKAESCPNHNERTG